MSAVAFGEYKQRKQSNGMVGTIYIYIDYSL